MSTATADGLKPGALLPIGEGVILLVALGVFGSCFGALAGALVRIERSPERCIEHVDAFISALEHRLGDPVHQVPLHLQDQISAAMADVTVALHAGRFARAREIAHRNHYLAVGAPSVPA